MGHEDSVKFRIQDKVEASDLVPSPLLCYQPEKVPQAPSSNSPNALSFPLRCSHIF